MHFLSTKYAQNAFAAPLGELTDFNVNLEDWKPHVCGWSMFVGIAAVGIVAASRNYGLFAPLPFRS